LVFGFWLLFLPLLALAMAKTHFENLRVYQLSETIADQVWEIVVKWDHFARNTVGTQLVRSADSIGANLSEGSGRGSNTDYKRFIKIARGSLYETRHWLRRAYKRKLLTKIQVESLTPLLDELTPTLNAYLRSIGTYERPKQNT
jgi:four helix bundle protein